MTMTPTSSPCQPDTVAERDPRPAAARPLRSGPHGVRRRDGITLAATGAIPERVRTHVLAQHRADLADRARARVRVRIDAGTYPLPIPYGYRRLRTLHAARSIGPCDTYPLADPPDVAEVPMVDRARCGRAPALEWRIDPDCAETIWWMARCAFYGMPPARIAAHLNADLATADLATAELRDIGCARPPLLTVSGRPQRWSARAVRSVLTDPAIAGHSVWGRTRGGRPLPRHEWMVSVAQTHPPLLDPATTHAVLDALAVAPCVSAPDRLVPTWSRSHR